MKPKVVDIALQKPPDRPPWEDTYLDLARGAGRIPIHQISRNHPPYYSAIVHIHGPFAVPFNQLDRSDSWLRGEITRIIEAAFTPEKGQRVDLLQCDFCKTTAPAHHPPAGWRKVEALYDLPSYGSRPAPHVHYCSDQCQISNIIKTANQPIVLDPKKIRSDS